MRPAVGIIRGPSLYRHPCRKCGEETLHNYLGCTRCETYPWGKPIRFTGNALRALKHGMKSKSW